ncbi:MAG: alpha/beta fold hydrolase [Acutalibacteraceae bacterium]|nr:alpha/beta fold hydrolase [Acutalibacteraceae bacterium]
MDIKVRYREYPSTDGIHRLKGKEYIPEGEPKGILHVVHGMTEHIGRYDSFLKEMAESGYVVVAYDNLGHGLTAKDDDELGYIAKKKGWKKLTDDVYVVSVIVKGEYPGLPYYLMGHSMGSFIVRNAVSRYPDLADKLIVMGTGGPMAATKAAIHIISRNKLFHGERHVSPFIENLAFGQYNKGFGDGSNGDWLSKDPEVRRVYDADKFCNYHFTSSAMLDLVKLNDIVNRKEWFKRMGKSELPILLVSGADDPVGQHSKGVKKVYQLLKKRGANVTMKLYENNRHEILNDTARDEVIADIKRFLAE